MHPQSLAKRSLVASAAFIAAVSAGCASHDRPDFVFAETNASSPRLEIIAIKCFEQEDNTGDDAAYIIVNGVIVWGPKAMDTDQHRHVGVTVQFAERAQIILMEDDDDPDDKLGSHEIRAADVGERELKFTEDEANYSIWIRVTR